MNDVGSAVRFYVETLGMKLVDEPSDGSAVLDAGEGFAIALRKGTPNTPEGTIALSSKVPIDEAIAVYENRGIAFTVERTEGRVVARFRDPDGNPLSLVS